MKQRLIWILCSAFLLCCALGGCGEAALLDPKAPVTLTFWHVYGSQADSPMNELVDRFNATVGRERGVLVNVTSVSNSSAIHDALVAAAHGEPGAGELPDPVTRKRPLPWGRNSFWTGTMPSLPNRVKPVCRRSWQKGK